MGTEVEEFLAEMLPKQRAADQAYHNGDVQPRLATWSHRDPVTLCGAVVPLTSGWDNLSQTFASLASRFAESSGHQIEVVAAGASGDLAYMVALEYDTMKIDGASTAVTMRSTHVYRRACGKSSTGTATSRRLPTNQSRSRRRRLPTPIATSQRCTSGGCHGNTGRGATLRSPKGQRRSNRYGVGCRRYCRWRSSGACHESGVNQDRAAACGARAWPCGPDVAEPMGQLLPRVAQLGDPVTGWALHRAGAGRLHASRRIRCLSRTLRRRIRRADPRAR
jgi:ketosteroid isomerase-like protein